MVKKAFTKAAESIAGLVSARRSKFDERRIIIVFPDKKLGTCVLGATDEKRFQVQKGTKAVPATVKLLREALPLFNEILNVDTVTRCNRLNFVDHRIEYEVVRVDFRDILSSSDDAPPKERLQNHDFTITPIEKHPLFNKLRLIVGRP